MFDGRLDPASIRVRLIGGVDEGVLERHKSAFDALRARNCLEFDGKVVPPSVAAHASATADYLLLLDLNESDASLQVPAKIFEYIQIGRPILAFTNPGSPVEKILRGSGIPFRSLSTRASNQEVDRTVLEFLSLPSEPHPPSEWFNTTFDGIRQTARLAEILRAAGA
jgi:hypothetical protein